MHDINVTRRVTHEVTPLHVLLSELFASTSQCHVNVMYGVHTYGIRGPHPLNEYVVTFGGVFEIF